MAEGCETEAARGPPAPAGEDGDRGVAVDAGDGDGDGTKGAGLRLVAAIKGTEAYRKVLSHAQGHALAEGCRAEDWEAIAHLEKHFAGKQEKGGGDGRAAVAGFAAKTQRALAEAIFVHYKAGPSFADFTHLLDHLLSACNSLFAREGALSREQRIDARVQRGALAQLGVSPPCAKPARPRKKPKAGGGQQGPLKVKVKVGGQVVGTVGAMAANGAAPTPMAGVTATATVTAKDEKASLRLSPQHARGDERVSVSLKVAGGESPRPSGQKRRSEDSGAGSPGQALAPVPPERREKRQRAQAQEEKVAAAAPPKKQLSYKYTGEIQNVNADGQVVIAAMLSHASGDTLCRGPHDQVLEGCRGVGDIVAQNSRVLRGELAPHGIAVASLRVQPVVEGLIKRSFPDTATIASALFEDLLGPGAGPNPALVQVRNTVEAVLNVVVRLYLQASRTALPLSIMLNREPYWTKEWTKRPCVPFSRSPPFSPQSPFPAPSSLFHCFARSR